MPDVVHLEPYSPTRWDQKCVCGDPNCRMKRYGGKYFIVQFETDSFSYVWWLSRS
jgi:hypothetical protein